MRFVLEYPFGRGINFQIEVDNLEEIVEKEVLLLDHDGYLLRFSQTIQDE